MSHDHERPRHEEAPEQPEVPGARPVRAKDSLRTLGKRIRALRERRGLTQEDFARRSGISISFASLLERGERSPSYDTLVQVAAALEVPLAELFRDFSGATYDDPYFGRLLDFARKSRLSRAQVDRLIAVASAMFDVAPAAAQRTASSERPSLCNVEDCDKPVLARGLCAPHYHRARRARL